MSDVHYLRFLLKELSAHSPCEELCPPVGAWVADLLVGSAAWSGFEQDNDTTGDLF